MIKVNLFFVLAALSCCSNDNKSADQGHTEVIPMALLGYSTATAKDLLVGEKIRVHLPVEKFSDKVEVYFKYSVQESGQLQFQHHGSGIGGDSGSGCTEGNFAKVEDRYFWLNTSNDGSILGEKEVFTGIDASSGEDASLIVSHDANRIYFFKINVEFKDADMCNDGFDSIFSASLR